MKKLYNITVGRIIPDIPAANEEDWTKSLLFGSNKQSNIKELPSPILESAAIDIVNRASPTPGGYQDKINILLNGNDMDIVMKDVYTTPFEAMCIILSNFRIVEKFLICDIECMTDAVFAAISANPVHTLRIRSVCNIDSVTNRPTEQEIITLDFLNE